MASYTSEDTDLEQIIKKINTTESYHNLRLTCKTFYELMPNIRRYYENGSLKEFIYFKKHEISGHQYIFYNEPLFVGDFDKRSYLGGFPLFWCYDWSNNRFKLAARGVFIINDFGKSTF